MAVAKEIVLEADASSSSSSSNSSTDHEKVEEVSNCFSSRREPLSDDDDDGGDNGPVNLDDNDVIKQSCATLSNEALKLLKHASRSVMKRKQRRIERRRGGAASITRSLYEELQSLRNLIAPHTIGDINSAEPCVITDALGYLTLLKQEIKDLNEGLMQSIKEPNSRVSQDAQVEVVSSGQRLEIYVSCNKRAGLLAELMLLLESTGLVFDDVNASCHHRLLFKACSTQKGVHLMDKQALRRAVLRAIQQM